MMGCARGETLVSASITQRVIRDIRNRSHFSSPVLTNREMEVIRMIAEGMSGPQISHKLFVAPTTIESHVQRGYEKLGVVNRGAAVAEAMRRGLLD
ncbi:response regulator transcription factor [Streptomyces sp. NPDC058476]|uniref:response regulator transcription factor n=1 Tax=Streptomyces sp. NPDC058476 TaxID=3346519 RepID=UPI0036626C86